MASVFELARTLGEELQKTPGRGFVGSQKSI